MNGSEEIERICMRSVDCRLIRFPLKAFLSKF